MPSNHFVNKAGDKTGDCRRVQSAAVVPVYADLRKIQENIIVAGDLNDHPAGAR